jgi:WD repeat-containing protein 54
MVVAAFGSGHLRIYEAANLALRTEVAAHSRWITGLDVAMESLLLVSCSEDSTFSDWKLSSDDKNKVLAKFFLKLTIFVKILFSII